VIQLFREARAVQESLSDRGWGKAFCFIGGVALQQWGEPRVTRDLDLSLFTGFGGEAAAVDRLLETYQGRISDARAFALTHRVLLLRTTSGIEVDVALGALPFEAEMIARAVDAEFEPGLFLHIAGAEDLFVMKAFADRLQDQADLLGIARRHGRQLDWAAIEARLTPLAEAKDSPQLLERVQSMRREFQR
jgi:hypothetical protein